MEALEVGTWRNVPIKAILEMGVHFAHYFLDLLIGPHSHLSSAIAFFFSWQIRLTVQRTTLMRTNEEIKRIVCDLYPNLKDGGFERHVSPRARFECLQLHLLEFGHLATWQRTFGEVVGAKIYVTLHGEKALSLAGTCVFVCVGVVVLAPFWSFNVGSFRG